MSEPEPEKSTVLPVKPPNIPPESGDESDDESGVLEESPCGRWQKRREEVEQRDVPGIDNAFLAMDTEEGVEVVWNEVQFSEKKNFRSQQDKIRQVFDNLIQLDHPNIVKFHKYWTDTKGEKPRVIFITEYMSSGSLKQFLKKTKKNNKTFQLRCFLLYSGTRCYPPACENLSENIKNMHCVAPEYGGSSPVTVKVDIYAFGMCALEMAALGIHGNEESGTVSQEDIDATLDMLENPLQRSFLELCIQKDPEKRPTARELLFHPVLFEVHPLKLLAAHKFVKSSQYQQESLDETYMSKCDTNKIIAVIPSRGGEPVNLKVSNVPAFELEKFLEDVKNGIYPLTAFAMMQPPPSRPRAITPELAESVKSETPEPCDVETRMVTTIQCGFRPPADDGKSMLYILLRMDDKMNRFLQTEWTDDLTAALMAEELVHLGFINELDRDKVTLHLQECISSPKDFMNGVGVDIQNFPILATAS
ncbi:hypothetical protein C0Q70_16109 [Pomacea canaliculata]|uniref:Serine-threonine/tyrosine-protein kinase catalytic domain-containing protein n=1 Tax=Pomacea canaliculata TaxID=400727 RepID=A0A2T7NNV2_POMCA|nr:hypothetical protein C0Q70_16109 [Pomacea canaliculata]